MSVQLEDPAEASQTIDCSQQQELCQHIRRLIQDHSLDLANGGNYSRATLDEALRNVRLLEQAARQS
jgi:hypothetical protein